MPTEKLEVHPTRLELLRLRRRKALAEGIADILQKDLETLIVALIEHRQRARALQTQLNEKLTYAYSRFVEAEMMIGSLKVREISLSTAPLQFSIEAGTALGVLGIELPSLKFMEEKGVVKPRFNLSETPVQLEESVSKIIEQGIGVLIEVGPGKVLSGLARQINREAVCLNVEDEKSLEKTLEALRN